MSRFRDHLIPLAVLLALPIALLLPALLPRHALLPAAMLGRMLPWHGSATFPHDPPFNPLLFDGIAQFYPWRLFAARTWTSGYVPLWNPYQFCGTPFLANDQSATLYPLNLLFLIMPVARAFAASAVLHLFLTGAFLYAFLRGRVGVWPALLGSVTWQLSDWQVSWLTLPTFLCTSAWIPLGLLLIDRCADAPGRVGRALGLGGCLGVMLLAGHLQIALYGLLLCAGFGLTLLAKSSQSGGRGMLALSFLLAAVVMLLLAAPQLLPTIELSRVSHRAGIPASMSGYAGYVGLAMPVYRLVTLFSPSFFGRADDYWDRPDIPYSETACFIGVAGLLLACIGAFQSWGRAGAESKTRDGRFFAAAAGVAMLFALGTPLNLLSYFGILGFSQSGSPARVLVLWSLCLAVLAAYGLELLLTRDKARVSRAPIWTWAAILLVPLVGAVLFVERQGSQYLRQIDRLDLLISLAVGAITLLLTQRLSLAQTPRLRGGLAAAFVALAAIDLMRAGFGFNSVAALDQVYPVTPSISFLQRQIQDDASTSGGAGRIVVLNAPNGVYEAPGVLPPNAATVYQLRDLQGYDSLQTRQYKTYLNQLNDNRDSSPPENGNMDLTHYEAVSAEKTAAEAGAEWIVSPTQLGAAPPAEAGSDDLFVYKQFAPSSGRAWTASGPTEGAGRVPAKIVADLPTRQTIVPQAAGQLVLADQYYAGWDASGDRGRKIAIKQSPAVFRTMGAVQAHEQVKLRYAPASFLVGLYLACAGLLICGAALGNQITAGARLRSGGFALAEPTQAADTA